MIFFGTSAFAVPSLERLVASGHAVVLCVTQPDKPKGRGLNVEASPVKQAALKLSVPLAQPERLKRESLGPVQADIGVVAAYGQLIRRDVLDLPAQGILGVHPSLLPRHRGAAPVAWALLNGDPLTGVTIFRLNERLDAGPMLRTQAYPVHETDTTETLTERLALFGADQLILTLSDIAEGLAKDAPQDDSAATLAPKLTKEQSRIHWKKDAPAIARQVRALWPWPGALTELGDTRLKIASAEALPVNASGPPGTVLQASAAGLDIAAGSGVVRIRELQPAGKRRMSAAAFLAGHPIAPGTCLGGSHA